MESHWADAATGSLSLRDDPAASSTLSRKVPLPTTGSSGAPKQISLFPLSKLVQGDCAIPLAPFGAERAVRDAEREAARPLAISSSGEQQFPPQLPTFTPVSKIFSKNKPVLVIDRPSFG